MASDNREPHNAKGKTMFSQITKSEFMARIEGGDLVPISGGELFGGGMFVEYGHTNLVHVRHEKGADGNDKYFEYR